MIHNLNNLWNKFKFIWVKKKIKSRLPKINFTKAKCPTTLLVNFHLLQMTNIHSWHILFTRNKYFTLFRDKCVLWRSTAPKTRLPWFPRVLFHCSGRSCANKLTISLECSTNKLGLEERQLFYWSQIMLHIIW